MRPNREVCIYYAKYPGAYLLYVTLHYCAGTYLVFQCVSLVKGEREEKNHALRL